jgi:hypothetical protein
MTMMKRLAVAAAVVLGLAGTTRAAPAPYRVSGEAVRYRTIGGIDTTDVLLKITQQTEQQLVLTDGNFWVQYKRCSSPSGYCKPVYPALVQNVWFFGGVDEVFVEPPCIVATDTPTFLQVTFVDATSRAFIMWYKIDGYTGTLYNLPITKGQRAG